MLQKFGSGRVLKDEDIKKTAAAKPTEAELAALRKESEDAPEKRS